MADQNFNATERTESQAFSQPAEPQISSPIAQSNNDFFAARDAGQSNNQRNDAASSILNNGFSIGSDTTSTGTAGMERSGLKNTSTGHNLADTAIGSPAAAATGSQLESEPQRSQRSGLKQTNSGSAVGSAEAAAKGAQMDGAPQRAQQQYYYAPQMQNGRRHR